MTMRTMTHDAYGPLTDLIQFMLIQTHTDSSTHVWVTHTELINGSLQAGLIGGTTG